MNLHTSLEIPIPEKKRNSKSQKENCLLQMEFVRGDIFQGSVEKYIADAAKKLGGSVKFVDAVRFQTCLLYTSRCV